VHRGRHTAARSSPSDRVALCPGSRLRSAGERRPCRPGAAPWSGGLRQRLGASEYASSPPTAAGSAGAGPSERRRPGPRRPAAGGGAEPVDGPHRDGPELPATARFRVLPPTLVVPEGGGATGALATAPADSADGRWRAREPERSEDRRGALSAGVGLARIPGRKRNGASPIGCREVFRPRAHGVPDGRRSWCSTRVSRMRCSHLRVVDGPTACGETPGSAPAGCSPRIPPYSAKRPRGSAAEEIHYSAAGLGATFVVRGRREARRGRGWCRTVEWKPTGWAMRAVPAVCGDGGGARASPGGGGHVGCVVRGPVRG
jgi:hypothetical protein